MENKYQYIRPILNYSCHQLSSIPLSNFLVVCQTVSQLLMPQYGTAPYAISPFPGKKDNKMWCFMFPPAGEDFSPPPSFRATLSGP